MKKLYKDSKISFLVLTVCLVLAGHALAAKPVALVNQVKGKAFAIESGTTRFLKAGDHVNDQTQVVTEEGGQLSFSDYYDHQYHLAGSGQVRIVSNVIELIVGYLWVQTYKQTKNAFFIQTPNAVVSYVDGEAVVSYDGLKGKTQLYSLNGDFEFAHLIKQDFKEVVSRGQFSFVSNDFENGAPRRATELGKDSYDRVRMVFYGVNPIEKRNPLLDSYESSAAFQVPQNQQRTPASMTDLGSVPSGNVPSSGKIIFANEDKEKKLEQQDRILSDYYQEKISKWSTPPSKKVFKPSYEKKSDVVLRIYGQENRAPAALKRRGTPESLPVKKAPAEKVPAPSRGRGPASLPTTLSDQSSSNDSDAFSESLMDEYKKQMRHSKEVNGLIQDLKNYKQDYQVNY